MTARSLRYTVHIGTDTEGFTVQTHRWADSELIASGHVFHRDTLHAANEKADELMRHRHTANKACVLTLSDEAQAAS